MVAHRQGSQHQGRMTGKILHNDRAAPTPTFATGMEEVASIADAGRYGTRFGVETTGPARSTPASCRRAPDRV
jgi:hypothetical protein